jgi:hypothetical protein
MRVLRHSRASIMLDRQSRFAGQKCTFCGGHLRTSHISVATILARPKGEIPRAAEGARRQERRDDDVDRLFTIAAMISYCLCIAAVEMNAEG